MMYFKILL